MNTSRMLYRKKPVEVVAMRYDGSGLSRNQIIFWMEQSIGMDPGVWYSVDEEERFFIITLEGKMQVSTGDYVICGVKGEFYPCKPDIFQATYEEV